MTVASLPTTPELAWLDAVEAGMDIPDPDHVRPELAQKALARIARHKAKLAAREMRLLRIVDDAELAKKSGSTSTSSMLASDFGGDQAACSRQVRTAQNLKVATLTERALAAGQVSFDKAGVIAKTMTDLPADLDELTRVRVEKRLIADAQRLNLTDLRRRVLRVADIYASHEQADTDENTALRLREARAWQNTELWFGQARDGLVAFGGKLPELQAALLMNQVGAIAAPRRNEDADQDLTFNQRMGRAFCHWIERIPTDGLPTTGGTPATLTVNLDYDAVAGQVREAAGMLATGTRISASEVRRLACSHGILPRVLDGKSQVLDQGRAKRLFTPAQRLAMADRDGGCTYPDCDRPPAWTEGHHL
ncbi:MAG: 13E12 repeat family protein, partial [Actinomycetota bacterium]|nr:13E12 repeat family protein [Actinomycetota bacterium]